MGSSPPLILRSSGRLTSARSVREATPLPENQLLLTKGDNNYLDDIELYQGLDWLEHKHIVGKVRGCVIASVVRDSPVPAQALFFLDRFLPYVGYVTIALVRGTCILSL
jgi:signal peptidase